MIKKTTAMISMIVLLTLTLSSVAFADKLSANKDKTSGFSGVPGLKTGGADTARSRFTYQLLPKQTVDDQFFVSNTGDTPLKLDVYAADATTSADGTYALKVAADPSTDVGSWVKFKSGTNLIHLDLKVGEDATVPFKLEIPSVASPGDHLGGIIVSTRAENSDGQIVIARRVATRLYARIRGDLSPLLTVTNLSATYLPSFNPFEGTVTEKFTITNMGNVSLKASAIAEVTGAFGLSLAGSKEFDVDEIAPGSKRDFELTLRGVGQWVYLHPSVKIVPYLEKDALDAGDLPTVNRDTFIWVFPTTIFFAALFIAIIAFAARSTARNRKLQVQKWLEFTETEARKQVQRD
jgi:dihydroorotate dehydrogenase (fumarate)